MSASLGEANSRGSAWSASNLAGSARVSHHPTVACSSQSGAVRFGPTPKTPPGSDPPKNPVNDQPSPQNRILAVSVLPPPPRVHAPPLRPRTPSPPRSPRKSSFLSASHQQLLPVRKHALPADLHGLAKAPALRSRFRILLISASDSPDPLNARTAVVAPSPDLCRPPSPRLSPRPAICCAGAFPLPH